MWVGGGRGSLELDHVLCHLPDTSWLRSNTVGLTATSIHSSSEGGRRNRCTLLWSVYSFWQSCCFILAKGPDTAFGCACYVCSATNTFLAWLCVQSPILPGAANSVANATPQHNDSKKVRGGSTVCLSGTLRCNCHCNLCMGPQGMLHQDDTNLNFLDAGRRFLSFLVLCCCCSYLIADHS